MVVSAAKPGSTPMFRLQFGNVGLCYRVPYHQRILSLWTNYGLWQAGGEAKERNASESKNK